MRGSHLLIRTFVYVFVISVDENVPCPMCALRMALADTEQTAGRQSLTADCRHDVFRFPPVLLWREQIESRRDNPHVFQHIAFIHMIVCHGGSPRTGTGDFT